MQNRSARSASPDIFTQKPMRTPEKIRTSILALEKETEGLLSEIIVNTKEA